MHYEAQIRSNTKAIILIRADPALHSGFQARARTSGGGGGGAHFLEVSTRMDLRPLYVYFSALPLYDKVCFRASNYIHSPPAHGTV